MGDVSKAPKVVKSRKLKCPDYIYKTSNIYLADLLSYARFGFGLAPITLIYSYRVIFYQNISSPFYNPLSSNRGMYSNIVDERSYNMNCNKTHKVKLLPPTPLEYTKKHSLFRMPCNQVTQTPSNTSSSMLPAAPSSARVSLLDPRTPPPAARLREASPARRPRPG